ncbi:hypothetical protein N1851_030896 [Merluccius polli]|uniref:Uncharacterized protein n=1 Tax=Merluccius polli TaxID=89951 RepID=A0AA47M4Q2_MERPO|nr:hypothetical protein N1851_030896 [Merluccius polli]
MDGALAFAYTAYATGRHCMSASYRLWRLLSDISPFPQNQTTDTNISRATVVDGSPGTLSVAGHGGAAGVGGGDRWAVEDLEGQLERKVKLLEKERKALRLEAEKHHHDINQGLHQLHLRLSGLEHAPQILLFGDSIIRQVKLPACITYCVNDGKVSDIISLLPKILEIHPSVTMIIIHVGANNIMERLHRGI